MSENSAWPQGFVFHAVKKRLVVAGPDHVARSVRNVFFVGFSCFKILDVNRVNPSAHRVDAVGNQTVVFAETDFAYLKECESISEFVAVEHDFFGIFQRVFLAAENRVFLAFFVSRVMIVVPDFHRHGIVILLDASRDFVKKLFLKRFGVLQAFFGIAVFCFKIFYDFGIFPFVEPIVIVDAGVSVDAQFVRYFLCKGRICRYGFDCKGNSCILFL